MTLEEKLELAEKKSQSAEDYRDIFNLISAQTYFLRVQQQRAAFENLWSKRDDISFGTARGRAAVIEFFIEEPARRKAEKLEIASKLYGIEISPENDGVGDLESRAAASPFIIVAADRKTAQGIWFTPCVKSEIGPDGTLNAKYIQEKIGVDLINEDGDWKIWHYNIYPDFTCELPNQIFDDSRYTGRTFDVDFGPPSEDGDPAHYEGPERPAGEGQPPNDLVRMAPYSPTKVPHWNPPLFIPYHTWTEAETLPMG